MPMIYTQQDLNAAKELVERNRKLMRPEPGRKSKVIALTTPGFLTFAAPLENTTDALEKALGEIEVYRRKEWQHQKVSQVTYYSCPNCTRKGVNKRRLVLGGTEYRCRYCHWHCEPTNNSTTNTIKLRSLSKANPGIEF
jgi:ribosomal protein L37AE/L43A